MAKVLGESGRYVSQEAVRQRERMLLRALISCAVFGGIVGFSLHSALPLPRVSPWLSLTISSLTIVAMIWYGAWGFKKLNDMEKHRMALLRGATGETVVALKLEALPDEFFIIHDLTTPFGNLDHLVIGPTGVYIMDAKSWRGVVSSGGNGELALNGKQTDKPYVRQFVGRMLGIRDRVRTLAPELDPYYQAVFVFTSARVEANWGSTGKVHCIRDDQLADYILDKNFGKRLKQGESQRLAQAFLALARMDKEFMPTNESVQPPSSHPSTQSA